MRQTIYVAGFPKSGSTWLSWLISVALDCPVGSSASRFDKTDFVTEGLQRKGDYFVRRGHFKISDDTGDGKPVESRQHVLQWRNITTERVVLIVRDPRQVVVSYAHYMSRAVNRIIEEKITSGVWSNFIKAWLDTPFNYTIVKYEDLLGDCEGELTKVFRRYGLPVTGIAMSCWRNSFERRKGEDTRRVRDIPETFFRKAARDDWREILTPAQAQRIKDACMEQMARLGYGD